MNSNNDAAPRLGEDSGAGATTHTPQDSTARRAMGQRPLPGDDLTCFTIAALRHPEARARFKELGIGPEAFAWEEERLIVAALLDGRLGTTEVLSLLDRDDGVHLPWSRATSWTLDPEWAVDLVERFAAERARYWLPEWLRWIVEGLRAGRTLTWTSQQLGAVLEHVMPLGRKEGAL